ncbi:DUF302 domain-containing protein [Sulfitobacter aestuariivivens]|uniref:DUF302 domain-containing protein n=1 Tax=Sulfitobacter aestuariivivens TaxID=2766981 RepID=A0A927D8M4_9RHOB|nr:DUF302 domain-containing protein [Sulfitobacter aestuariivivens]MBD3666163.1 DUF302 domain-containing protein [Sulfitobacter aestuariivivens]
MRTAFFAALIGLASTAQAQQAISVPYDGSFDDAAFAVESAILDKGLVIDYVSHVGEMLNRTGADVGSDTMLFKEADIFIFCSAVISREVMEADPMNIAHCPYGIFVAERDDGVMIGYRSYPDGAMQKVQTLLSDIVAEATAE